MLLVGPVEAAVLFVVIKRNTGNTPVPGGAVSPFRTNTSTGFPSVASLYPRIEHPFCENGDSVFTILKDLEGE